MQVFSHCVIANLIFWQKKLKCCISYPYIHQSCKKISNSVSELIFVKMILGFYKNFGRYEGKVCPNLENQIFLLGAPFLDLYRLSIPIIKIFVCHYQQLSWTDLLFVSLSKKWDIWRLILTTCFFKIALSIDFLHLYDI